MHVHDLPDMVLGRLKTENGMFSAAGEHVLGHCCGGRRENDGGEGGAVQPGPGGTWSGRPKEPSLGKAHET